MKIQSVNINNNYTFQARKKEIKKADDLVRNVNLQFPAFSTTYADRFWLILNNKYKYAAKKKALTFQDKINTIRDNYLSVKKEDRDLTKTFRDIKKFKVGNCAEKCLLAMGALSANGYQTYTKRTWLGINWRAIDKRTGEEAFSKIDDLDHTMILSTMKDEEPKSINDIIIIDPWLNKAMSMSEAKNIYKSLINKKDFNKKRDEFVADFVEANKKDYGILGKKLPLDFNLNDYEIIPELSFFKGQNGYGKLYGIKSEKFEEFGKVIAQEYPELILKDKKEN